MKSKIFVLLFLTPYYLLGQLTTVTELDEIRASCMAKFPVLSSVLTPLDPVKNEYDSEILGNDMFLRKKEKVENFVAKYKIPVDQKRLRDAAKRKELLKEYSKEQVRDWLLLLSKEGDLSYVGNYLNYREKLISILPKEDSIFQKKLIRIGSNSYARYFLTYLAIADSIRQQLLKTPIDVSQNALESDPSYRIHYTFYQYCTRARLGDTLAENTVIRVFEEAAYAKVIDQSETKLNNDRIAQNIAAAPLALMSLIKLGKLLYWIDTPKSRAAFWKAFSSPHVIIYTFKDKNGNCFGKQISLMGVMLKIYTQENHGELNYLKHRILRNPQLKIDGVGSDHLDRLASLSNSRWYYYECVTIWLNKKHNLNLKIRQHFEKRSAVSCQFIEGLNRD